MSYNAHGVVVWHDLFTKDLSAARTFYAEVAGWHYLIEHAEEFAWGGGEQDFVLALAGDQAGAGFIACGEGRPNGWIPYIEVHDVDETAGLAHALGGSTIKPPFEVPGVGRNCILRDPFGAVFGICISRHRFPVAVDQFGPDVYVSRADSEPERFYRRLFGWEIEVDGCSPNGVEAALLAEEKVAVFNQQESVDAPISMWVPTIKLGALTSALDASRNFGGEVLITDYTSGLSAPTALIRDCHGEMCALTSEPV